METKDKPKYKGNLQVALWEHKDKNGKDYFTLKIGSFANLFEIEEIKPEIINSEPVLE